MFGLRVYRHRFIECNGFAAGIPRACDHRNSGIGALAGKVTPIKTERYATDDVAAHRAGFEDDSFAAKRVVYPSRNGTTRVDYVYVGKTTAITSMIHDAYKRNFCRSVKEVLRLTDQLRHLTADELQAERERYAQESKARLPEGARQFYPVYGLSKKRGSNEEWTEALGLDVDLTRHELRESVPPAFSRCIAQQFIDGGAVTPTPSRR